MFILLKGTYTRTDWIPVINSVNTFSKTKSIQNAKVQRLNVETVYSVVSMAALQCCDYPPITN
jgi:hypothetical protein